MHVSRPTLPPIKSVILSPLLKPMLTIVTGHKTKSLIPWGKSHLKMMLRAIKVCWDFFFSLSLSSHMAVFIFKVFLSGSRLLCRAAGLVWPNCELELLCDSVALFICTVVQWNL